MRYASVSSTIIDCRHLSWLPTSTQVWGALFVLRVLARKYEFKDEEERAPLAPVVNAAFPPLLAMLQVGVALSQP